MTSFTVSALVERRRDIQREIAYLEHEIKKCEEAIGHIDATIHLLDPCYELAKLKPKQFYTEDALFHPGEVPVLVLEILRGANHPMTTPEITNALLARKGPPEVTKLQYQRLNSKVNAALNIRFRQRLVKKSGGVPGELRAITWEVMREEMGRRRR
ncbi:MAG: hypothetical protein ACM33T_14520 [Solirubrobacterales bacterium]